MIKIGRTQTLEVLRTVPMGLILGEGAARAAESGEATGEASPDAAEPERGVLLPKRYVPSGLVPGDSVEVFVYTDSEDRPVATTDRPLAEIDEFAGLRVVSVGRVGAFLDWGLPKDLLLPFRAQWSPVQPGEVVAVRVQLDEVSGRPVASSKIERFLRPPPPGLRPGQPVDLLVYHETDLGCKAIVDDRYGGLLYRDSDFQLPAVGERTRGVLRRVRPDGLVDLALRPGGRAGMDAARETLEAALVAAGGRLALTDKSDPKLIREELGLSKKAFKRAVGALYRERRLRIEDDFIEWVEAP